jgi:hypothetical protein
MIAWVGCDPGVGNPPPPASGTLTLTLAASPPALTGLTVTGGGLELEHIAVIGDVAPDPRSMLGETKAEWTKERELPFKELPQGLYSRVRFDAEKLSLDGTWQGTPLKIRCELHDLRVDLRSPSGREISPGHDARFRVGIDATHWLDGVDLSSAQLVEGQIRIDEANNAALRAQISAAVSTAAFQLSDSADPVQ